MSQGASTAWMLFRVRTKVVDPSLILGHSSESIISSGSSSKRDKIYLEILISSVNILGTHLAETLDIPKMSVRLDWTAPKTYAHFTGYIWQVSPSVTRDQTVPNLNVFIYGSLFRVPRPFIIFNALLPPPKFSSPFLQCAIRRGLLLKGFHEVFMSFLQRHSLLTEVHYDCSTFNYQFCQFDTPFSSLRRSPTVIKSLELLFSLP